MAAVAIVEDEQDIRLLYAVILGASPQGWEVRFFHDGQEAIDGDWTGVFAAIVDLSMPKVDGSTVLRWLTANHPKVRRIICSALPLEKITEAAEYADAVIRKPFGPEQLWGALA